MLGVATTAGPKTINFSSPEHIPATQILTLLSNIGLKLQVIFDNDKRSEVLAAVNMKLLFFCVVTPRGLVGK